MSAFIVSDLHTFTIASFAAERITQGLHYVDPQRFAQDLADRLKRANIHSVNFRYDEKTPARKCKAYANTETDPATVYRLFECWSYQACEDSQSIDFHALSALIKAQFTAEEIHGPKPELWAI